MQGRSKAILKPAEKAMRLFQEGVNDMSSLMKKQQQQKQQKRKSQ